MKLYLGGHELRIYQGLVVDLESNYDRSLSVFGQSHQLLRKFISRLVSKVN